MRHLLAAAFALAAGAAVAAPAPRAPPAGPPAAIDAAYVVTGERGAIVRAVTAGACPVLTVDGRSAPMVVRFAAATVPQRPTASPAAASKASVFKAVCEGRLPLKAKRASIGGTVLPLPRKDVRRIVVIGDTGCRIKAADHAAQACNDPHAFPLARIAAAAAAEHPDLVVHVGDYLYRENACPADAAGCSGSPWGYGWDAWRADFFAPAAPLLAAAVLAPVRGNHETCERAGQGWWRLLDGHPAAGAHDCDDPANDRAGNASPPYAVALGGGAQLVLLDLAAVGSKPLAADDPRRAGLEADWQGLATLAGQARFTFAADHYPVLAFAADKTGLLPGSPAIQSVWGAHGPRELPPHVDVLLSGHYHLWEQVGFAGDVPSQFVTGFSGTLEDTVPLPATLPAGAAPAPGATPTDFASWVDGFGYMVLDRAGKDKWQATVHGVDGGVVDRCTITGQRSHCEVGRVPSAPGA